MTMETERYRPSNGTEGMLFMETFCDRCARDSKRRPCSILGLTMGLGVDDPNYPKEWINDAGQWPGNPRCTAFRERKYRPKANRIRDRRQVDLFGVRN